MIINLEFGPNRGTSGFQDLCTIVHDKSDTTPQDTKKYNFFFGKRTNLQVMWEYCVLSNWMWIFFKMNWLKILKQYPSF